MRRPASWGIGFVELNPLRCCFALGCLAGLLFLVRLSGGLASATPSEGPTAIRTSSLLSFAAVRTGIPCHALPREVATRHATLRAH